METSEWGIHSGVNKWNADGEGDQQLEVSRVAFAEDRRWTTLC